jgi:hypothetical protein
MSKIPILQADQSYTFRAYFEMPYGSDEILAEFGYTFSTHRLAIPKTDKYLDWVPELRDRIESFLPRIRLTSETARREILVAPVLLAVAVHCNCQLRIEYPLTVNNWLKGYLDYLLRSSHNLLVVEAKNDDLTRGFTQLAVEMIALAQAEDYEILYGAVTIGNVWQFGCLDVKLKEIVQIPTLYRVPEDIEELASILVGIISEANSDRGVLS